MTDLKIYSVTLVFSPPGPVWASLVIARDEATASAIATHHVMTNEPLVTAPLLTVMALPVDPDMLRGMLRTIEGRGPGEVVSLVPKAPPAAMFNAATACHHGTPFDAVCSACQLEKNHVHVENDTAGQEYGPPLQTAPYAAIQAQRAARLQREREDDAYWAEQRAAEILRKHEPALKPCRHDPTYLHCTCDPVSCTMLRSTANPAGLESSLTSGGLLGGLDVAPPVQPCPDGEHEWVNMVCVRCDAFLTPYQYAEKKPLDAADASTFTGKEVTEAWESYRAAHPDVYIGHRARENRQPPLHYWGEEYGPPWPVA